MNTPVTKIKTNLKSNNFELKVAYVVDGRNIEILKQNKLCASFNSSNAAERRRLSKKVTLAGVRNIRNANKVINDLLANSARKIGFKYLNKLYRAGWKYPNILDENQKSKVSILFVIDSLKGVSSKELKTLTNPCDNVFVRVKGIYNDSNFAEFTSEWYKDNTVYPLKLLIDYVEEYEELESVIVNRNMSDITKFITLYKRITDEMSFYPDYCSCGKYFMQGILTKGVTQLGFIYIFKELLDRNMIFNKFYYNFEDSKKSTLKVILNTANKFNKVTEDEKTFFKTLRKNLDFLEVELMNNL